MIVYKSQGIDWQPQSGSLGVLPLKQTWSSSTHSLVIQAVFWITWGIDLLLGCFTSRFVVTSISVPHALGGLLVIWWLAAPTPTTPLLCLHPPASCPLPLTQFSYLLLLLDPSALFFIAALTEYSLIVIYIVLALSILLIKKPLLLTILITPDWNKVTYANNTGSPGHYGES